MFKTSAGFTRDVTVSVISDFSHLKLFRISDLDIRISFSLRLRQPHFRQHSLRKGLIRQFISDPSYTNDMLRTGWILFYLFSNVGDVAVYGS